MMRDTISALVMTAIGRSLPLRHRGQARASTPKVLARGVLQRVQSIAQFVLTRRFDTSRLVSLFDA
jgi:hypothetical protein